MPKTDILARLEGINLNEDAKKRIARGLQDLVTRELAGLDEHGDLVIKKPIVLGPEIYGMVAKLDQNRIHISNDLSKLKIH